MSVTQKGFVGWLLKYDKTKNRIVTFKKRMLSTQSSSFSQHINSAEKKNFQTWFLKSLSFIQEVQKLDPVHTTLWITQEFNQMSYQSIDNFIDNNDCLRATLHSSIQLCYWLPLQILVY